MTREETKQIFAMVQKGPTATQWRGQAVHILSLDDRLGHRGTRDLEVRHGQGAGNQYNVQVPNIVVTKAATDGMKVHIALSGEALAMQVYTVGHWDGQLEIQCKLRPRCGEPLHTGVLKRPGRTGNGDTLELHRADKENEKCKRDTATEELDIPGTGREAKDMLQQRAQRLRGKATPWYNVLIQTGETQPGLKGRIR